MLGFSDVVVKRGQLLHRAGPDIQFWLRVWRISERRGCYNSKWKCLGKYCCVEGGQLNLDVYEQAA
jgi:hypothetical protein